MTAQVVAFLFGASVVALRGATHLYIRVGLNSVPGSQLGVILRRTVHACGGTYLCDAACDCPFSEHFSVR